MNIKKIKTLLEKKEKDLDKFMKNKRKMLRHLSKSIKYIHMKKYKRAEQEIKKVEKIGDFQDLIVQQEYVEAKALLYLIKNDKILDYKGEVEPEAYVLGMFDLIGEIKREMYEYLRKGDLRKAKKYFNFMNEIYDSLLELNFSNLLIPEFRRKQDIARIQIDQANSVITNAML